MAVSAQAEGTKRPITAKDLMRFTWAADPRIAPDGSRVAFVKVAVDADKDDYVTSIWLVPAPSRRTESRAAATDQRPARCSAPMVARRDPVDLRAVHREGRKAAAAPALPAVLRRGRARPLTDLPKGASSPAWSPDGKTVAFLSGTTPEDLDKARRVKKGEKPERESDVRIVTREEFRRRQRGLSRRSSIPTISGRSPFPDRMTRPPTTCPSRGG